MKFIKKQTDYAFQALVFLAKNAESCNAEKIASELDLPKRLLKRILQTLASEGLVKSTKGRSGGFKLNVEPKNISMAEVIKIFQGEIDLTNCLVGKKACKSIDECFVRQKLKKISQKLEDELKKITLK